MNKKAVIIIMATLLMLNFALAAMADTPKLMLGNEVLMAKHKNLIKGKKIGLVTNQSGVNSQGKSLIDILATDESIQLVALYGPEHGIDGVAKAGAYVESYTHPQLGIPVYSLYGSTRMPTKEMLDKVDVLLFDMQDIGARTYTYMSTLNYVMVAAQKYNKPVIVLDRPNPVGGEIVEGPVLEDPFKTFVGVDNLPMAHGMTAGELALFFNRDIGADVKVIPMEGYTRKMNFLDTGLTWVQTSPNIPDIDSVFGYMATGLGEGTGIYQADQFKWIGGKGIDSQKFANLLNQAGLSGVTFIPENKGTAGGVRLRIDDYHSFNPARAGIYALTYGFSLGDFKVPKSGQTVVMFDKIMGTDKIGRYLEQGLTPQQIEANYAAQLEDFKKERGKYLIYGNEPYREGIAVFVKGLLIDFDAKPFIDQNNRLMVPLRAIAEALGAQVDWNPQARSISINKDGKIVFFTVDSTLSTVNGQQKQMDTTPVIKNSRTMVPLRFVGEFLGTTVNWNNQTKTVTVE
ncbi:MAG: DUF1343 domain-containing protein [Bacillota bacterium]|nr:DUF1343 domain-containing protein [Bacillota bacterium]